jgi:lysozyme family protein
MAYISYEKYGKEYQRLWDTMRIIRDSNQLHKTAERIKKYQDIYEKVEQETGVPWQMVAVIHLREAGLSDIVKWKGVLHNGEKIVGTGRKTRIVPIGRGPFSTWHQAAVHALREKGFHKIKDWPVSRMLWALEPYNGYGYRNKGLRSPYLWASTNHQQPGKYVRDHVFDPRVMDTQVGCAAQLKYLGVDEKPGDIKVIPMMAKKPLESKTILTGAGGVATAAATVAAAATDWKIVAVLCGAVIIGAFLYIMYDRYQKGDIIKGENV